MSGVAKDLNELKLSHINSGGLKCYSRFEKTCMHGFLLGLKGHIPPCDPSAPLWWVERRLESSLRMYVAACIPYSSDSTLARHSEIWKSDIYQ